MNNRDTSVPGAFVAACLLVCSATDARADMKTQDRQEIIEEVVVRAHPLSAEGLAQPVAVIRGEELSRAIASSLGETLTALPGVHSSSFGQAVGRPVIRGLGGPRVKILEDRIDSLDVSVSSPDHLTTIEALTAESIEVLKGPSTLLYGTGAIGGVVDVHTGRIPHSVPDDTDAKIDVRSADNADRQSAAARVNSGFGNVALHVDGFYRDADEYEIPGYAESSALRRMEAGEPEAEEEDEAAYGELPASQMKAKGGGLGLSWVGERGFIGIAASTYRADYGLPGHSHAHHEEGDEAHSDGEEPHEEQAHEDGRPRLHLEQSRVDLEAGLAAPLQGIASLNLRVGMNDYEHTEIEGGGESGTRFTTDAVEGRIEFVHEPRGGVTGSFGLQFSRREFAAVGEEAFVEPVDTNTLGAFYVGQISIGEVQLEGGVRFERVNHDPTAQRSRSYNLNALSLGLIRPINDYWSISAQVDRSSRAPIAEELFSNGPHLVTNSYEIGIPSLDEEKASNLSTTLQYRNGNVSLSLNAYRTNFTDFIFQAFTEAEIDELPVLLWAQEDAVFTGFEADLRWRAFTWDGGSLSVEAGLDVVQANLSGPEDHLPRIPPRHWRLGTMLDWHRLVAGIEFTRADHQRNIARGELPSQAYENLSVHLGYRTRVGRASVEFFLRGNNLTDDEQRYHTSFIKDFAPQPGRTVEGGITLRI